MSRKIEHRSNVALPMPMAAARRAQPASVAPSVTEIFTKSGYSGTALTDTYR